MNKKNLLPRTKEVEQRESTRKKREHQKKERIQGGTYKTPQPRAGDKRSIQGGVTYKTPQPIGIGINPQSNCCAELHQCTYKGE